MLLLPLYFFDCDKVIQLLGEDHLFFLKFLKLENILYILYLKQKLKHYEAIFINL